MIGRDVEGGPDASQEIRDAERGAGLLEYVISHFYLRQTFLVVGRGDLGRPLAKAADSAQLRF